MQISRAILSYSYDAILVRRQGKDEHFEARSQPAERPLNLLRPSIRLYAGNNSRICEQTLITFDLRSFSNIHRFIMHMIKFGHM